MGGPGPRRRGGLTSQGMVGDGYGKTLMEMYEQGWMEMAMDGWMWTWMDIDGQA